MADARIAQYTQALEFAERQVQALTEKHPDFFPIYTVGGKWHHAGELWTDWTGGFLAGMMWQFQRRTGSPDWRKRAEHYSKLLEHRQHDRKVHDLGFIFLNTYLPWYETSHDEHLHQVLVQAGRTLAMRFMEKGQYLQSFVAPESLFIDIMMNVPIIFYAAAKPATRNYCVLLPHIAEPRATPSCAATDRRPMREFSICRTGSFCGRQPIRGCATTAPGPAVWRGRCTVTAKCTV